MSGIGDIGSAVGTGLGEFKGKGKKLPPGHYDSTDTVYNPTKNYDDEVVTI